MRQSKLLRTLALLGLLVTLQGKSADTRTLDELNLDRVNVSQQEILKGFSTYRKNSGNLDQDGWTILKPSKDSRLIFVSSSKGNDNSGKVYRSARISDKNSPGKVFEFRTIHAALKHIRPGHPDYLLLKRGDRWLLEKSIVLKGGRSTLERLVIGSYGSQPERPVIESAGSGVKIFGTASFVAIVGVHFYAFNRDPDSAQFSGWGSVNDSNGILAYSKVDTTPGSILIENCLIEFFRTGITLTGGAKYVDITVRRNIIRNSYSENSHSQGFYAANASVLLEKNLLDHNGWFLKRYRKGNSKNQGQATIFNHNIYFANSKNSLIRDNIFLRASSAHIKLSTTTKEKTDSIRAENLIIRENFFYGGEIGVGAWGNNDRETGARWKNISAVDNVMIGMGKNQPTNRTLGWYLVFDDLDTGNICGNYLLDNQNSNVTNLIGISVNGHSSDLVISHNTVTGLIINRPTRASISLSKGPIKNTTIANNLIGLQKSQMRILEIENLRSNKLGNNTYYSGASISEWFLLGREKLSFDGWARTTSDINSRISDETDGKNVRDFESYINSIGASSIDQFVSMSIKQGKSSQSINPGARSINDYMRQPFNNQKCPGLL